MTQRPRPTLRCLSEDLGLQVPPVNVPLDEIQHPLLDKAIEQFTDASQTHERIRAIDDQVVFKVKVGRWRGAVWIDDDEKRPWLLAAGTREDGSPDDFYEALTVEGRRSRARYNGTHSTALSTDTHTQDLRPNGDDYDRYRVEAAIRFIRSLEVTLIDLTRASLLDGHEHDGQVAGARVGVLVRADDGHETYIAIRITGPVPRDLTTLVLDCVPGCERTTWYPEAAMPTRLTEPREEVWSNIMDPATAAKLVDQ